LYLRLAHDEAASSTGAKGSNIMATKQRRYRVTEGVHYRVQPLVTAQRFQIIEEIKPVPPQNGKSVWDELLGGAAMGALVVLAYFIVSWLLH
jgi:hypothetical protein